MAKERRVLRLQQLILEVVAEAIQREIRDPRIGLVSITRVKLLADLSQATLYWSVLGDEGERTKTERGLEDALGLLQRAVAREIRTRVTPRLTLAYDESMQRAQRLETIFEQLKQERGESDPTDEGGAADPEAASEGEPGTGSA